MEIDGDLRSILVVEEDVELKKIVFSLALASILCTFLVGGCAEYTGAPRTPSPPVTLAVTGKTSQNRTPTPAPSATSTSSSIPSVIVTLPAEDARLELLNLLANNGNCRLPCLWGITPGKTTLQQAAAVLMPLSGISDFTHLGSSPSTIAPIYSEDENGIYTSIAFLGDPSSHVVTNMSFSAQELRKVSQGNYESVLGGSLFDQMMKTYSVAEILSTYGPPTDVLLRTNSGPPPQTPGPFEFLLSYPELGILLQYTGVMTPIDGTISGCPTKTRLDLFLTPPGRLDSTEELLALRAAPMSAKDRYAGFRPIQDVTSMTVDGFVRVFSEPTDQCIETPANLWPPP